MLQRVCFYQVMKSAGTKRYLRATKKLEISPEEIIERTCAFSKSTESNQSLRVRDWEVT